MSVNKTPDYIILSFMFIYIGKMTLIFDFVKFILPKVSLKIAVSGNIPLKTNQRVCSRINGN